MQAVKTVLFGLAGALSIWTANPALAKSPVVVELFTSQGCSSCLEANGLIQELGDQADIIALTFAVDYWDYLGWSDSFAQAQFTDRQKAYMRRLGAGQVYTPQIVVGGSAQAAGTKREKVEQLIRAAKRKAAVTPRVNVSRKGQVTVGIGRVPQGGAEVWLVRYSADPQNVEVKRGENRGKTVTYHHVVRDLVRLGRWRGKAQGFKLPNLAEEGVEQVVLIQSLRGGHIIAAKKLVIPERLKPVSGKNP